jgi:PAS domain S-box-containing protein
MWFSISVYSPRKGYFVAIFDVITDRKQAEEALKASEANFRNSIDSSLVGIHIVDTDGQTLYLNQTFLDIFGYENSDEVKAKPPHEYYTPESYAGYLQRDARKARGEPIPDKLEVDIARKDSTVRHLQLFRKEIIWGGRMQYQILYNDVTDLQQAEKALKILEQNLHNSLDSSLMGIYIIGANWEPLYVNQAFLDIFGYENIQEVKAKPPQQYYTPGSYTEFLLRGERAARGEANPETLEVDITHKDGNIRHLQLFGRNVLWNGKPQPQILYLDITERKQAEEALKLSEQNFRSSMDSSVIGVYIVNHEWNTIYVNNALLRIFGYENIEEVRASPPVEHYTPESLKGYRERSERLTRGLPNPEEYEVDIIRKDGGIRHLQVFRREVFWDGKKRYQALYHDITKRKQAEEALKLSEQNYRNSIDNSSIGIRIFDKNNHTMYANQAFVNIFGYENMDEAKSIPPQQYYSPDAYASWVLRHKKLLCGEPMPKQVDIDITRKDGTMRYLDVSLIQVFWDGKLQYQSIYNDITERKLAEEALRLSEQNYRNSLDSSTQGIRIVDKGGRILYLNQTYLDIFGYENIEEANKKSPHEFYTPDSFTNFVRRGEKIMRGEPVPRNFEIDIIRKDGTIRHLQLFGKPVFWDGKDEFQILYNDITERVQAEEALKASEQNFRNSVDSSSMGIHIIDSDNKTLYANQALMEIFGYKNLDEVKTTRPYNFYTPAAYADFVLRSQRIARNETIPDKVEVDITRADGTMRYLQVSRTEVFWDGKRRFQTLYNDVTEQKKIELALRESEEKYRTIFESANDIIILLDANGKILDVNARLADIGGYARDELIGKKVSELTNIISKENMEIVLGNFLKIFNGLEAVSYQVEMIKKNGEPIFLEVNGVPVRKDEKAVGVLALLSDITESNKSELQIKEQKALTDRILGSIPASVIVVGRDQRIIMVNKAFEHTFELTRDKAENKEIGEIIRAPTFINTISQVLAGGLSQFQFEFRFKKGAQERVLLADIISTQKNEVLAILNDVTEEREIQERLYLTDRLASLGEMAAGIAHELNNPLTGVVALSQLMLEAGVPPEIKDDLEAISSEGQRAASVVKNLLSFARSHTLSAQPVEINAIITQVLSLRVYEHRVNNIEVVTDFAPNLPDITADRFQMQQVFLNIVLNAEQAMIEFRGRGNLTVTTELLPGIIKIAFSDNGPGIPPDILNRIFDPFFTTKEVGKGTGLGLSICYGIVTKQGGRIYAQSQPGQGATFVVELPVNNAV